MWHWHTFGLYSPTTRRLHAAAAHTCDFLGTGSEIMFELNVTSRPPKLVHWVWYLHLWVQPANIILFFRPLELISLTLQESDFSKYFLNWMWQCSNRMDIFKNPGLWSLQVWYKELRFAFIGWGYRGISRTEANPAITFSFFRISLDFRIKCDKEGDLGWKIWAFKNELWTMHLSVGTEFLMIDHLVTNLY